MVATGILGMERMMVATVIFGGQFSWVEVCGSLGACPVMLFMEGVR